MLIDSHAHLDDRRFDADRAEVIKEIENFGVTRVINIGADIDTSKKSVRLAQEYPFIYAAVGVHPHDTENLTEADIAEIKKLTEHPKVVAIGEIGLDYYYENSAKQAQQRWFARQLELAKELNMPVVIHNRDAHEDCMKILREHNISNGVMHCYLGSAHMAEELLEMGFYISFTGVITFKNARRALEALTVIPTEKLLIETDCPYLAPEPHRGERNHCGYVKYVAEKVAEIKGLSFDEVAEITAQNTKKLFGID